MAQPLGGTTGNRSAFGAADVTAIRLLDTDYTNGDARRLVIVSLICIPSVTGQAMAGYRSVLGGQALLLPSVIGVGLGVVLTGRFMMVFPIDPGGVYRVTTNAGAGGSVTVQQWLEVDL